MHMYVWWGPHHLALYATVSPGCVTLGKGSTPSRRRKGNRFTSGSTVPPWPSPSSTSGSC